MIDDSDLESLSQEDEETTSDYQIVENVDFQKSLIKEIITQSNS
jgi:hypothetical protein